ncbi:hypothetical protein AB1Y20_019920 [Prymnesium parvum]|uniref:Uncharacterized protein n=1 Tax=Prymnesium parvum TaxID=97485 RepID=A0AB34JW26_PRYPA
MVAPRPWRGRLKSLLDKVTQGLGFHLARKVRFVPEASVYEFERKLLGGGGVPENDVMSLGLGQLVNERSLPLAEKQSKDEYASSGYLDCDERTRLLEQWEERTTLKAKLAGEVGPELQTLQRKRSETKSSSRDQRFMPANQIEAIEMASKDEAIAKKMASASLRAKRRSTISSHDLNPTPKSTIRKTRRRHSL